MNLLDTLSLAKKSGVKGNALLILSALNDSSDPLTTTTLQETTGLTFMGTHNILKKLRKQGFVLQLDEESSLDGRCRPWKISTFGKKKMKEWIYEEKV